MTIPPRRDKPHPLRTGYRWNKHEYLPINIWTGPVEATMRSAPEYLSTPHNFEYWLRRARRGHRCVYWVGDLANALGTNNTSAAAMRNVAWRAKEQGEATLVQRRSAYGIFEYMAVKL